jgi:hypothetical protein
MKRDLFLGLLVVMLAFGFFGCGGDDITTTDNTPVLGSVTIANFPENYRIGVCSVSDNPNYSDWGYNNFGVILDSETWSGIGNGGSGIFNGKSPPRNVAWIAGKNDESGNPTSISSRLKQMIKNAKVLA